MVDGKRSFGDLAPMVSVLGDPEVLLTELESAGFIELVGAPAISQSVTPSVEPASLATAKTVPAALPVQPTLDGARRFTTRLLTELLGPRWASHSG